MFEPISVSLLPNAERRDVFNALRMLFSPGQWQQGPAIQALEADFKDLFPGFQAISFVSGRTALLAILKALEIGQGDEVLLPSFTCVAVANAVLAVGAKPVYVDIDKKSFNLDPADLKKKITSCTKAVLVQHTFGYPAQLKKILALTKKHRLKLIEDCAHGIDVPYQGQKLGMFGDAAFFSFGRDKAISATFGGLAITKNKALAKKIWTQQQSWPLPSRLWVIQQLLHPIIFSLLLPVYNFFSLGKIILIISQKLKLLSWPVVSQEKKGKFPLILGAQLPNALASLARSQLKRLESFNHHRRKLVSYYAQELKNLPLVLPKYQTDHNIVPLLRFTIQTDQAQALYEFAKKRGVLFNNWYCPVISPQGVDYRVINYHPKTCPQAEKVAPRVVNLPTHPRLNLKKAAKVVAVIKEFYES